MAVGDAHVFPVFFTPGTNTNFFPKLPTTFLTCFSRGERRKYAGKKFASTWSRTHNHQVTSQTRSPLSHPGGARFSAMNHISVALHIFLRVGLKNLTATFKNYFLAMINTKYNRTRGPRLPWIAHLNFEITLANFFVLLSEKNLQ